MDLIPLGGTTAAEKESIGFFGIYKKTDNNCKDGRLLFELQFVFDGSVHGLYEVKTLAQYYGQDMQPWGIPDLKW